MSCPAGYNCCRAGQKTIFQKCWITMRIACQSYCINLSSCKHIGITQARFQCIQRWTLEEIKFGAEIHEHYFAKIPRHLEVSGFWKPKSSTPVLPALLEGPPRPLQEIQNRVKIFGSTCGLSSGIFFELYGQRRQLIL